MTQFRVNFIGEGVTGTTGAGAQRAAALDHEIGNNSMKGQTVVISGTRFAATSEFLGTLGQTDKIGYGQRCFFKFEQTENFSSAEAC